MVIEYKIKSLKKTNNYTRVFVIKTAKLLMKLRVLETINY